MHEFIKKYSKQYDIPLDDLYHRLAELDEEALETAETLQFNNDDDGSEDDVGSEDN